MQFLTQKKGFLGYDANQNLDPKVIVVPFGLEKTVSYGSGTKNGPKEIIKASHQVELFDEELNKEPYKEIGIKTLKPFTIKKNIKQYKMWKKYYSGSSGLMGVKIISKNKNSVIKFLNKLKLFAHGYSWGGFESLALYQEHLFQVIFY